MQGGIEEFLALRVSIQCWGICTDEGGMTVVGEGNPPGHQSFTDANWGFWEPLK